MVDRREPTFEVVSPIGTPRASAQAAQLAARLPELRTRRIAFVWDHVFHGDRMFERFAAMVSASHADVEFVRHETFGNIHGTAAEEHEAVELLPSRMAQRRVDAAVVGVGA